MGHFWGYFKAIFAASYSYGDSFRMKEKAKKISHFKCNNIWLFQDGLLIVTKVYGKKESGIMLVILAVIGMGIHLVPLLGQLVLLLMEWDVLGKVIYSKYIDINFCHTQSHPWGRPDIFYGLEL